LFGRGGDISISISTSIEITIIAIIISIGITIIAKIHLSYQSQWWGRYPLALQKSRDPSVFSTPGSGGDLSGDENDSMYLSMYLHPSGFS